MLYEVITSSSVPTRSAAVPRPAEIFDPVARGLDVIGDRWTLVLVRHLLEERVNWLLLTEVNPALASHGGRVSLVEITERKEA